MKLKIALVVAIVVATVLTVSAVVLLGQNFPLLPNAVETNPTVPATPSTSSTPTSTDSPSPSATINPLVSVKIESVSIDNATAASVTASSQTGGDILITEIILKDASGNTLSTDDSIQRTLPADGSPVKITINQNNVQFTLGGTFTLTIVTSYGASYTSQSTYPPFY